MTAVCADRLRLRANRLDIVAVEIDQERGEIARAAIGSWTAPAIVASAGLQSLCVKFLDRRVVGRAERNVRARAARPLMQIKPERRRALGRTGRGGTLA